MNRRQFIQSSGWTALSYLSGIQKFALAQTPLALKTAEQRGPFIILFLRGGADGLSMLSPLEDSQFLAARPPQMLFEKNSMVVSSESMRWYWHPAAEPLAQLMQTKRLVPWHAVGLRNETRSHFEAQEMMERGVESLQNLPDNLGVISRIASVSSGENGFLYAGSNSLPRAFQGNVPALAIKDLQNGVPFPGGPEQLRIIENLVAADSNHPASKNISQTIEHLSKIQSVLIGGEKRVKPYESSGQINYPNTDPGVGLRSIARLIQANIGLQYAWVDHGGWDMHVGLPQRMNQVLGQLSQGLLAFDQDMQAQNKKYTLVVLTEFGRRFRSNNSNGTDHGHGGLAMVLGSHIQKYEMMGKWPGLNEANLDRGVDLAVTSTYSEVIQQALNWSRLN